MCGAPFNQIDPNKVDENAPCFPLHLRLLPHAQMMKHGETRPPGNASHVSP